MASPIVDSDGVTERIVLALRLLRAAHRYKDAQFSIEELRKATQSMLRKKDSDFPDNADLLINSLYRVRKEELRYERGDIGKPVEYPTDCNTKCRLGADEVVTGLLPIEPIRPGLGDNLVDKERD